MKKHVISHQKATPHKVEVKLKINIKIETHRKKSGKYHHRRTTTQGMAEMVATWRCDSTYNLVPNDRLL